MVTTRTLYLKVTIDTSNNPLADNASDQWLMDTSLIWKDPGVTVELDHRLQIIQEMHPAEKRLDYDPNVTK